MSKVSYKKIKVDYYVHFEWFSFLILPQIKWPAAHQKSHNCPLLFLHMKIYIIIVDYIKKNFDFRFSFLILPQIKWPDTPEKLLFFHMKIQIIIVDYIKKNFDFIHRQNFYRASKLTIKKYFSGIITGISLSQHVNFIFRY